MSIQEWAIRKEQRDHQRETGTIAMLKGEAERTRKDGKSTRVLTHRDMDEPQV